MYVLTDINKTLIVVETDTHYKTSSIVDIPAKKYLSSCINYEELNKFLMETNRVIVIDCHLLGYGLYDYFKLTHAVYADTREEVLEKLKNISEELVFLSNIVNNRILVPDTNSGKQYKINYFLESEIFNHTFAASLRSLKIKNILLDLNE